MDDKSLDNMNNQIKNSDLDNSEYTNDKKTAQHNFNEISSETIEENRSKNSFINSKEEFSKSESAKNEYIKDDTAYYNNENFDNEANCSTDLCYKKYNDSRYQKISKANLLIIASIVICYIFIGFIFMKEFGKNKSMEPSSITTPETETIIYRESGDISDVVETVATSIVSITSTAYYQQFDFFTGLTQYEGQSSGSGVIVGKDDSVLYIVTNNHVIEGSEDLTIEFSNGKSVSASINGTSTDPDIAVLTVRLSDLDENTLNEIKVASLHTEDDLKVGNQVIAIGNALGYGQSVTVGYISALDRTIQTENGTVSGLIQTDAAINPGNSGGALVNMNGELIGINVAKYADTEVEGIGYSIPITNIQNLISMLSKEKIPENEQGFLGIQCTEINSEMTKQFGMPQGIYVYKITNQNLVNEGLCEKDIITEIDGQPITSIDSFTSKLEYYRSGENVNLAISRIENGEYIEKEITITLIQKGSES